MAANIYLPVRIFSTRTSILSLYTILVFVFASCMFHPYTWQGTNPPGHNKASFKGFSGKNTNSVEVTKGNLLLVSYNIRVTQGTLLFSIENKGNKLFQKSFSAQADSAELKFSANETGVYKIAVQGKNATGSFDINYKAEAPKKIAVKTNKYIELFGLMLQLDNGPDFLGNNDTVLIDNKKVTWRNWYALAVKNYLRYKQFDSCTMMTAYRRLLSRGLYNDFFVGFLLQVDEVPFAKINAGTDKETIMAFSKKGDVEEAKKNAAEFLDSFNSFYKETNFENYLNENKNYYELIKADVEKNLPNEYFLPTMENFYQKQFNAYCLVPSLNILTSMGFGKMNRNTQTIYNTFGPFSFQVFDSKNLDLGFDFPERICGLSVHEFGHSFVNPAIDKVPKVLIDSTEYLFTPIKSAMSKLAYPAWKMCLYEHFVKAGEVIIARKLGDTKQAEKILQDNVKAKFIYLPTIVEELEKYDKNKNVYKSYDDFVPLVIEKLKIAYKE